MKIFPAQKIGIFADECLKKNHYGEVMGVTSKGIFLKLTDQSIIFITNSGFGNPLTVNLSPLSTIPSADPGELISLANGEIRFTKSSTLIHACKASHWSSKKSAQHINTPPDPIPARNFLITIRSMLEQSTILLDEVLACFEPFPEHKSPDPEIQIALRALIETPIASSEALIFPFQFFAGRGRGLTPSGDDLLLGWIYALGRWVNDESTVLSKLHQVCLQTLENRTTAISLSLIKAATRGEIDERLLYAFEMMIGIRAVDIALVRNVLEWGSSSGIEVCAGMGLGILTLSHQKRSLYG